MLIELTVLFKNLYSIYGTKSPFFSKIFVDLRIGQYPDGRTHDHGTGFRIKENDHHLLFKVVRRIG